MKSISKQQLMSSKNFAAACFSPLVMLLTFSFEFTSAAYLAWRYKLDKKAWLIIAILINLGVFQIAEWQVCANHWAATWARVGFAATAILIPLGLYLIDDIRPDLRVRRTANLAFGLSAAFIAWFVAVPESVTIVFCGGNYTFFRVQPILSELYSLYYWGSLSLMVFYGLRAAQRIKSRQLARALRWFVVGILTFMLPTLIINGINPIMLATLPSVLCGFAVAFAIVLISLVAPAILKPRRV